MTDKKSTILDLGKLAMSAPKQPNGEYPPKLKVQLYNNNPQITIFSGVSSAPRSGIVGAGMNPTTFFMVLNLIEEMIARPATDKVQTFEIENHGGRGNEKAHKSTTVIGKDENGIMFISVVDVDGSMPKVRFDFNVDFYHKVNAAGIDKAQLSCMCAKAWADTFRALVPVSMTVDYEKVVFQGGGNRGGNRGGGYNNNQNTNANDAW